MRPVLPLLATLVLACPAFADCPQSTIGVGCFDIQPLYTTAPTARADGGTWTAGTPCPGGCFDVPNGALHADATGSIYAMPYGCSAGVQLVEDYQLVGVAPGAHLSCQAILTGTGSLAGTGLIGVYLDDESGSAGSVQWSTTTPGTALSGSVTLALTLTEGVPLRLAASVGASDVTDDKAASIDAVLRFAGLPKAVSVTSCRAYNLPVPARTTSWGSLKSTYR